MSTSVENDVRVKADPYIELDSEIVRNAPLVFDTRNATEGMKAKNLVRL